MFDSRHVFPAGFTSNCLHDFWNIASTLNSVMKRLIVKKLRDARDSVHTLNNWKGYINDSRVVLWIWNRQLHAGYDIYSAFSSACRRVCQGRRPLGVCMLMFATWSRIFWSLIYQSSCSNAGKSVDNCRLLNIISVAVTLRASRGNVTTSTPYTYLHTIM